LWRIARSRSSAELWSEYLAVGRPIEEILELDATTDLLEARNRAEVAGAARTSLSVEHLRWRYGFEPLRYRAVAIGKDPADGFIVVRLRRRAAARELVVALVLGREGMSPQALSACIARTIRAADADHALTTVGTIASDQPSAADPNWRALAQVLRCGFMPMPGLGPTLTTRDLREFGAQHQPPSMLIVTHEASRTGAPKVAAQLATAHARAGFRTALLWRWPGPALTDSSHPYELGGEPFRRVKALLRRYRYTKRLANAFEQAVAERVLRTRQPGVVWANSTLSAPYALAAAKLGVPFVLFSHEPEALARSALSRLGAGGIDSLHSPWGTLLGCSTATATDLATAISVAVEGQPESGAENSAGAASPSVGVLASPVDMRAVELAAAEPTEWPSPRARPDRFVVGCGVANRTKGVDVFAAAASSYRQRYPGDSLDWVWVGRRPSEGVDDGLGAVTFVGEVANPASIIRQSEAFVLTSRVDPFPLVVLEAMALRIPVVATDLPGTREQLGAHGTFVPIEDPDAVATAVRAIVEEGAQASALADAAYQLCADRWDIAHFTAEALAITRQSIGHASDEGADPRPSDLGRTEERSSGSAARAMAARSVKRIARDADRARAAFPRFAGGGDGLGDITVLAYHRVGPGRPSQMRLDLAMFRRQLDYLSERAVVLSLDEAVAALGARPDPNRPNGAQDPRPRVVLTFDDGTEDFADLVVTELVERQLPATLYVATHFVETAATWEDGARAISWAGLRDCASTGLIEIGGHTHSHLLLDRCSTSEAAEDLERADSLIGERLGLGVAAFAYPKAVLASPANERLVATRYTSAAVAGTRPNRVAHTNPHRLHRSPIQRGDGWEYFLCKVRGGMRLEDDLRRAANRLRYRGRST
jgi:glycosyltransferase involved in cell wall biosynthesis/peptidoglycan/xylan/chitin deacetylase (PgdA/CDA1 family)